MTYRKGPNDTPTRNFRVPDDLWAAAKERAAQDGTTVTDVVIRALTRYAKTHRAPKEG